MPLVATSGLPAFEEMRREGFQVTSSVDPQLPTLKVGLLNLMPDAALRATDRQFLRQVSPFSHGANVKWSVFTVAESFRSEEAKRYIAAHYDDTEAILDGGLDALIITGANPAQHDLTKEAFWHELITVMAWAAHSTRSVLYSCLATHAALLEFKGVERQRMPAKKWGVYSHDLTTRHELVEGIRGPLEVPHSRWYDINRTGMETAGLTVLLESNTGGVLMAVDRNGPNVYLQGHPEYEVVSLLKEYTREVERFRKSERDDYPPTPEHFFDDSTVGRLGDYRRHVEKSLRDGTAAPPLDESLLIPNVDPIWSRAGQVIYGNWLRRVIGG